MIGLIFAVQIFFMTIHREGYKSIAIAAIIFASINLIYFYFFSASLPSFVGGAVFVVTLALFLFIISFFRIPNRQLTVDANAVVAPADGKVVVIEEVYDEEYFKAKRLQVSIFMSPANVHVNRNPIDGEVVYNQYHKGKYLVAWHPKSSTENERTTMVLRNNRTEILVRQIAGALARRICYYVKEGQQMKQNEEFGFIRFGSRVDIYFPLGTKIDVKIGDVVQGGVTVLGSIA